MQTLGLYQLIKVEQKTNWGLCNDGLAIFVEMVEDGEYFENIFPCWDSIEDQSSINRTRNILKEMESQLGFTNISLSLE